MTVPAPSFDVRGFQKKIDSIVGLNPEGKSIVRLRWARDCKKWLNYEWDSFGSTTKGEMVQKYCAFRVDVNDADFVEVSPPRWILEERFEPGQYSGSWDAARYVNVPTSEVPLMCRYCLAMDWINSYMSEGIMIHCKHCQEVTLLPFVRRDIVGPAPTDGWYNALDVIGIVGVHNKQTKELFGPWGGYRVPNENDLNALRRAIYFRNKDVEYSPHAELSGAGLQQAREWGLQMIDEQRKAINA